MGSAAFGLLMIPIVVFMVIVAPLWLVLHYKERRSIQQGLSEEQQQILNQLLMKNDQLTSRIAQLEKILSAQDASWDRDR